MMNITKFDTLEDLLIVLRSDLVLIDQDVAKLFGVATRDVNKAVKNNPHKFSDGYVFEVTDEEFQVLRGKFSTAKFAKRRSRPKAFTEKGLYMLATILKGDTATQATIQIIETFAKIKELSRNINAIMKSTDEKVQRDLAEKSNKILEEVIDIDDEVMIDDEDGEIVETTTRFEFNLGFAKVSRSIKRIKK
jgi:phage regulator Rha-like protein